MNRISAILIVCSIWTSCTKYEDDPFISTYTSEKRLVLSSAGNIYWVLKSYTTSDGQFIEYPDNLFALKFFDNGTVDVVFAPFLSKNDLVPDDKSYIFSEILNSGEWFLENNKKTLNVFGKKEIQKLTMTELKLKNESNGVYFFEKKVLKRMTSIDFQYFEFTKVPLFGLFKNNNKLLRLTKSNPLNYPNGINMVAFGNVGGTTNVEQVNCGISTSASQHFEPLLGTAFVSDHPFTLSSECSFSTNFANPGYITFFFRKSAGTSDLAISYFPSFFVNDVAVSVNIAPTPHSGINWRWHFVIIPISTIGNVTIKMIGEKRSGNGIDEIRQWEVINN
jgi:hypothetical protein